MFYLFYMDKKKFYMDKEKSYMDKKRRSDQ